MKNIAYTSDGVWEFFTENKSLMCYNPIKEAYEKIDDCDENDFDVSVCENDNIYVMLQKYNSFYIYRYNGNWQSECILDSNTNESYYKNIVLISNNDWLNSFYVLKHDEKYLLIHHILGSRISPEIIAEGQSRISFSVTKDENRNIYIAYNNEKRIILSKYIWKNKSWDEKKEILSIDENVVSISLEITNEHNPLVVVCCENNGIYKVVSHNGEALISGVKKEIYPCIINSGSITACVFEYYGKMLECRYDDKWQKIKYLQNNGSKKREFVKISGPADFAASHKNFMYTYAFEGQHGLYVPIYSDLREWMNYFNRIRGSREVENAESFADVKKHEQEDITREIKKLKKAVENDDTSKILVQIANRLSSMENVLSKVVDIVSELNSKYKSS